MPASSIRRSSRAASNGMDDAAGFVVVSMIERLLVPPGARFGSRPHSAGWWDGLAGKASPADAPLACRPLTLPLTLTEAIGNVRAAPRRHACASTAWRSPPYAG